MLLYTEITYTCGRTQAASCLRFKRASIYNNLKNTITSLLQNDLSKVRSFSQLTAASNKSRTRYGRMHVNSREAIKCRKL